MKDICIEKRCGFQIDYQHDYKYLGMRGYEDAGPNPVHIQFHFYAIPPETKDGELLPFAAPMPLNRWSNLCVFGWISVYVGEGTSPGLAEKVREIFQRHTAPIDSLDADAAVNANASLEARSYE